MGANITEGNSFKALDEYSWRIFLHCLPSSNCVH